MTQLPPTSKSPWQALYRGAHALRRRWWVKRARHLSRPVISIGNLHWGGTGKTPVVAAVAAHLRRQELGTAVLSRGYRSTGRGVRIVSDGDGPLLGPLVAGDEPVLLAGELPGVSVVVGSDRFEAGRHALVRLDPTPDIFVLDDGFSHLRLARDLDLLTLPAADPFGGGRLPPSGRLREPLSASRHAHAILVTGGRGDDGRSVASALRSNGFAGPGFSCAIVPGPVRLETGGSPTLEALEPGSRVLLVAAIAGPQRFATLARDLGFEVAGEVFFEDHHRYPDASLDRIRDATKTLRADAVLTTSKDRVKLSGRLRVPLAELPIHAEPEPEFWHWLDQRVDGLVSKQESHKPARL